MSKVNRQRFTPRNAPTQRSRLTLIAPFFSFSDMSRSSLLESENKRLSLKVDEMKEICSLTSTLNVRYKTQLDQESSDKAELVEANRKLKLKLNELAARCTELGQKVKVLEASLGRRPATRLSQPPPVQMISSIADVIKPSASSQALVDLQKRFGELELEHQKALNVIDELEFELGDVSSAKLSLRAGNCIHLLPASSADRLP
jgi:hypothetical protein